MNELNNKLLDDLVDEIYKKIEAKFYKSLNTANVEFCSEGIVSKVSGDGHMASVALAFSGETDMLPNLTGETLAKGNKVKVFYNRTNMSGAYIGVKF